MFDLVTYMEDVARTHRSIGHTTDDPKFFRCSGIGAMEDLLTNLPNANGTVLMVDINQEGNILGNLESHIDVPSFTFFLLQQSPFNDMVTQDTVKKACKELGFSIIAKLKKDRYEDNFNEGTNGLKALDLTRIPYDSIGPIANDWYGVVFTFRIYQSAIEAGLEYNADDYQ